MTSKVHDNKLPSKVTIILEAVLSVQYSTMYCVSPGVYNSGGRGAQPGSKAEHGAARPRTVWQSPPNRKPQMTAPRLMTV